MKKIRIKKCPTGGTVSELGYSDNSPYRNAKSLNIQGNNITMQNTGKNLQLIPMDEYGNILDAIDAPAYSGEYNFPDAKSVLEIPKAQTGKEFKSQKNQMAYEAWLRSLKEIELLNSIKSKQNILPLLGTPVNLQQTLSGANKKIIENPKIAYPPKQTYLKTDNRKYDKTFEGILPIDGKMDAESWRRQMQPAVNPLFKNPVLKGAVTDKTELKTPITQKNPILRSKSKQPIQLNEVTIKAPRLYDPTEQSVQNALLDVPEDVIDNYNEGDYDNAKTTTAQEYFKNQLQDSTVNPELNSMPTDKTLGNLGEIIKKGFKGLKIDTGINEQLFANARARLRAKELQFPMYQQVNMQEPAFAEESERPYVNQIQESYNTALQNINPNSTTGQAMVAQLQANASNQINDVLGQVFSRNLQRRTDYFNNLSSMRNQEQLTNQQLKQQYVQGVQGTIANRDSILNSLDEDLANKLSAQKQFLNNTKLGLWMAGTPSDAYKINDDSIELDYSQVPMDFTTKSKTQSEGLTGKLKAFKDKDGNITIVDEKGNVIRRPLSSQTIR